MTSFLDALKTAPQSSRAKVNIFLTSFNPNAKIISIFLEGRDDPSFIRVHARKIANEANVDVSMTVLGRKKDVIDAWQYLDKRFPDNPRLMFFVDKDHDDLVNSTVGHITQCSLFVTTYYSIENYLVSEDAIAVVLTDIWGLDSTSGAIEAACYKFNSFQESYHSVFIPWMAWLVAARRSGKKPQNNNIPSSILSVDDNYIPTLNWDPDIHTNLEQKCSVTSPPNATDIALVKSELEGLPTKIWLRGKQELWCLIAFLNKLEQEVNNSKDIKSVKIRSRINISNAVELLAPRLPCPKELNDYLTSRLAAL